MLSHAITASKGLVVDVHGSSWAHRKHHIRITLMIIHAITNRRQEPKLDQTSDKNVFFSVSHVQKALSSRRSQNPINPISPEP